MIPTHLAEAPIDDQIDWLAQAASNHLGTWRSHMKDLRSLYLRRGARHDDIRADAVSDQLARMP